MVTMDELFSTLIPVIGGFFALVILLGAILAFRQSYAKQVGEMHRQIIDALKEQRDTLEKELEEQHKEIEKCKRLVKTMRYAFERLGVSIQIDDDHLILRNTQNRNVEILPLDERKNDYEQQ
jgi:hypothetical protein